MIAFGFNNIISGGITGEVMFMDFYTTGGAEINGKIRLVVSNATGTLQQTVYEGRTEKLRADPNDRMLGVLMPLSSPIALQDDKLLIQLYPDGSSPVTIDYDGTDTGILIPASVYQ